MTDDLNPASMWRMNWLRKADNRLKQDKAVVQEEPYRPIPRYPNTVVQSQQSSIRSSTSQDNQTQTNSNDGMLTGAMLGYWIASSNKSSDSSSSSDSYDSSSSSDSGSFSDD